MQVIWTQIDNTLYATFTPDRGACYRLIVEQLPSESAWDWAVWGAGQSLNEVRHGSEPSAQVAMTKAEACVNVMSEAGALNGELLRWAPRSQRSWKSSMA
jgi:hypothetical protein